MHVVPERDDHVCYPGGHKSGRYSLTKSSKPPLMLGLTSAGMLILAVKEVRERLESVNLAGAVLIRDSVRHLIVTPDVRAAVLAALEGYGDTGAQARHALSVMLIEQGSGESHIT